MQDYQGNSNKSKTETVIPKKDLEKVITGKVVVKQKSIMTRFKNIFFGGDTADARAYVIGEVILPALRNLAVEAVAKGSERLVYGESAIRRRPTISNYAPRVSYNRVSSPLGARGSALLPDQPARRWEPTASRRTREDIILALRSDADNIVESMTNIVDQYEVVSVADLNELLGQPSSPIDHKWGWTNLASIEVRQVAEGYQIAFPAVEEIS